MDRQRVLVFDFGIHIDAAVAADGLQGGVKLDVAAIVQIRQAVAHIRIVETVVAVGELVDNLALAVETTLVADGYVAQGTAVHQRDEEALAPGGAVGNSTDAKTYPVSWRVFSSFSRKALISSPVTSLNVM